MRPTSHPAADAPYPETDDHAAAVLRSGPGAEPLEVELNVVRHWRPSPDELRLHVCYRCAGDAAAPAVEATVDGVRFSLDEPVRLLPVIIPKPWGREIWFTGMEARGESRVAGHGGEVGLGSYLALAPYRLCRRRPIVLLKVLDPLPEPVRGELYLEVHEEKQEVYVVTAVDPDAWPEGRGRIRYGVSQAARRASGSDDAFRRAFLSAVSRYESVRAAVDAGETGLGHEEQAARDATRTFIDERELAPGDVIRVPARIPHSLQHGVRVVEFQTPTYERLIVSSSQRVLTQPGWDSARAIACMHLDTPEDPVPDAVAPGVDRIAAFDGFGVWRVDLDDTRALRLPAEVPYALIYCIRGGIVLGGASGAPLPLAAQEAAFVPHPAVGSTFTSKQALLLVAAPGL